MLIENGSKSVISLCSLFQAKEEVYFGTAGRHKGFNQERLESDKIDDNIDDNVGSMLKKIYLPLFRLSSSQNLDS